MMKRTIIKNEKGLLSIEACVSVTVFMLFMLFLYSFFVVFEVRNTMAHALLSTANSMSVDAIRNTEVGDANSLVKPVYHIIYGVLEEFTSGFTDKDRWYENWEPATGGISDKFKDAITERFLAYLASGDDDRVAKILDKYHVVDGAEGLDFSKSTIDADGNLHIVLQYSINYEFNVFSPLPITLEQSACSKIWKSK